MIDIFRQIDWPMSVDDVTQLPSRSTNLILCPTQPHGCCWSKCTHRNTMSERTLFLKYDKDANDITMVF